MLKAKSWLLVAAAVVVVWPSQPAAGDGTLRILVEKSMTFYGGASLEDATRRVADAGFNVFVPYHIPETWQWGTFDDFMTGEDMAYVLPHLEAHNMFTIAWNRGTRHTESRAWHNPYINSTKWVRQDGSILEIISPNSDDLWNLYTDSFVSLATASASNSRLLGTFLDFETYPWAGEWAYSLSYDDEIMGQFAAHSGITVPSLQTHERYPWLANNGHHDAFEQFQIASWRDRARNLREQIDAIDPTFQFFVYPGMKSLFINEALLPELATPEAPMVFGLVDTYGRGQGEYRWDGGPDSYLPDHEGGLHLNEQSLAQALADIHDSPYGANAQVFGGIASVRGSDPEFNAANALLSTEMTGGYWVWFDNVPGDPNRPRTADRRRELINEEYLRWYAQANEAIVAGDLAQQPRQTQDLYQLNRPDIPETGVFQIGVYGLDSAIVDRLVPLANDGLISIHWIEWADDAYLAPLDMLILQDAGYPVDGLERGPIREFVRQHGKNLVMLGNTIGLYSRPEHWMDAGMDNGEVALLREYVDGADAIDRITFEQWLITDVARELLGIDPASDVLDAEGHKFWTFDVGKDGNALFTGPNGEAAAVWGTFGHGQVSLWGGQPTEQQIDGLLMPLLMHMMATPIWGPEKVLFNTDFGAGYSLGNLAGQQGWTTNDAAQGNWQVITPSGNQPEAPLGSQYLAITKVAGAGSPRAYHDLAVNGQTLNEAFTFEVGFAYSDIVAQGTSGIFLGAYLNNAAGNNDGVIFGFKEFDGQIHLAYRDSDSFISLGLAEENTFYHFLVDVNPNGALTTYDITVFDLLGNEIGYAAGAASRYGLSDFSVLQLAVGTGNWGGTLYVDGINLIPEPASVALLGLGGLMLWCRRRVDA